MNKPERAASPDMRRSSEDLTSSHLGKSIRRDEDSLSWLIRRFSPLLLAQAEFRLRALSHPICGPQELVADVWLAVIPKLPTIEPRVGHTTPALVRFLSTTLRERVVDLLRESTRRVAHSLDPSSEAPGPTPGVPAAVSGIVVQGMEDERVLEVLESIRGLSDQDREMLVLRGIEQSPVRDVAAMLGIEEAAASVRFHRTLEHLRARLEDDFPDLFVLDAEDGSPPR